MSEHVHERVLRGIPLWLLRDYLEELGGTDSEILDGSPDVPEELVVGDGWQARLTQLEDYKIGSLSSGQVRLLVTGDADEVRGMLSRLAPRLTRGGG
jgi:hypothetical protein